jgi:hypothetical protein
VHDLCRLAQRGRSDGTVALAHSPTRSLGGP